MSTSLAWVVLVGLSATGLHDHGVPRRTCCEGCSGRPGALQAEIRTLRTSPRWRSRDDAAEALRKFDWRRHPEAVLALCDALTLDPKDDVREEAAESLKKMAPGVPMVHEALLRAASADPEDDVRDEARDALKAIGKRCIVECHACGPTGPGSNVIPPEWTPILAPAFVVPAPGVPTPDPSPSLEPIPPASLPQALPDSDRPPPPPVPYDGNQPVGTRSRTSPRVR